MNDVVKNLMLEKKADLDYELDAQNGHAGINALRDQVGTSLKNAGKGVANYFKDAWADKVNQVPEGDLDKTLGMWPGIKNRLATTYGPTVDKVKDFANQKMNEINALYQPIQHNAVVNPGAVAAAENANIMRHGKVIANTLIDAQKEHQDWENGNITQQGKAIANTLIDAQKEHQAWENANLEAAKHFSNPIQLPNHLVDRSLGADGIINNTKELRSMAGISNNNSIGLDDFVNKETPTQTATDAAKAAPTLTEMLNNNAELAGAGIGGLAGAGLGAYLGGKNNRGLGAAIGGLGGATVGGIAGHLLKNASIYAPTLTEKYAADSSIERRELPKQNKMDIVYYPDVGKHALVAGALAGVGNISPTTGIGTGLGVYAGGKLGRGAGAVLGFPNVGAVLGETLGGAAGYYAGHKLAE